MRVLQWLALQLQAQRGALFSWSPVFLGTGICVYFAQGTEPSVPLLQAVGGAAVLVWFIAWRIAGSAGALLLSAAALSAGGFALAGWRAHDVAAPILSWPYYGPVEGRIVALDRSASDAVRVTLDRVRMGRISPQRTPERVRISLHGDAAEGPMLVAGGYVMTTARVSPPSGPVEPGGFDFQRHSWFQRLGGVGYTRVPMVSAGPPDRGGFSMRVFQLRMAISSHLRAALPGDVGGFAAAVTSGDRSGMTQTALTHLRASNLAHLLAISGLHMGLLTGCVFAALRWGLVLIPSVALRWPTRRIAAMGALIAGAGYLSLSGGNVATERAFIMAAVALCAVMLNRRAISLRSVAIAALVVLVLRPEALLGPGFQMSFAATTALVAVFNMIRHAPWSLPRWTKPVSAVFVSSGVAGLATAPFAAAHFNAFSHYGLPANILSVPIMGIVVVPAAVLAVVLAPLGLSQVALWVMGAGLWWILQVAEYTANLPGARSFVLSPGAAVLPLITFGALVMILWQGRARFVGVLPILTAFGLWNVQDRPALLISDNGGIVGIMTDEGRALSRAKGSGFVATNWLENDGDGIEQALAHKRWPGVETVQVGDMKIVHITGKKAAANPPECAGGLLISNAELTAPPKDCTVFDPDKLRETGAVALRKMPDGSWKITTARQIAGERLWSQWPERSTAPRQDQYVRISPTNLP